MPMTVLITRDVADRFRGFLASCMLEVAPGIYVAPELSPGLRRRIWTVMEDWHATLGGTVVMTWQDKTAPGRLALAMLGEPPKDIVDHDGLLIVKR